MSAEENTGNKKLDVTASVEEGPYYKPGSPERVNIVETGTVGTRLVRSLPRLIEADTLPFQNKERLSAAGRNKFARNLRNLQKTTL